MDVQQFIKKLSSIPNTGTLYNPYTDDRKAKNLSIYLTYMLRSKPKHLIIAEAPGYLGCALSGIHMTDEFRLSPGGNAGCLPLQESGYQIVSEKPHREKTATVIWESLVENSYFPLLWNIVPFHPHELNNQNTNRTPTRQEIETHCCFVNDLMTLFPSVSQVYALGRKAEGMLKKMKIPAPYIPHPSFGGASICREEIAKIAYEC